MSSKTGVATPATLIAHFNAVSSLESDLRTQVKSMLVQHQDHAGQIWNALKHIPIAATHDSINALQALSQRITKLYQQAEALPLSNLSREHGEIIESLSRLSKRAAQQIRVGCLWQAPTTSAPSVSIAPSSQGDAVLSSYPRYLLRGQVQAESKQNSLARCSYTAGIGITSAKLALTLPSDLIRSEETYQQHLRFHCNGWYQKRGPTQWISLGDNPSWMVDQISNYGWRRGGHKIAFIDTSALARAHIPFARSSDLVHEAGLQQYSSYDSEWPPWNEVKFATDSHWLIWSWIPAECITWVDLDDFEDAHERVRLRRSGSYRLTSHDSAEILEQALAIRRARELSRMPVEVVKSQVLTSVTEVRGADEIRHVEHAMQTLAVNSTTASPVGTRSWEQRSRSVTAHAPTQATPKPATRVPINVDASTQTMPEPERPRPARADASTQSLRTDPATHTITQQALDKAIELVLPIATDRALDKAVELVLPIATEIAIKKAVEFVSHTATDRALPKAIEPFLSLKDNIRAGAVPQQPNAGSSPSPPPAHALRRRKIVVRLPKPPIQSVSPRRSECGTPTIIEPPVGTQGELSGELVSPTSPPIASDITRAEASDYGKSDKNAPQAGADRLNQTSQPSLLTIDEIDAELERMNINEGASRAAIPQIERGTQ